MPTAIHHVDDDSHEGPRVAGAGHCDACAYVATRPGGAAACKAARLRSSQYALKVCKPATFLCHMGFACVSAPALPSADQGFVLTMGPYCPAEAPELLMKDAMRGLVALGHAELPFFPTPLTDIHQLRSENVPALAEWTVDAIETLWQSESNQPKPNPESLKGGVSGSEPIAGKTNRGRPRRLRSKIPDTSAYRGAEIAAALASGDQTLARTLVKTAIAELGAAGERQLGARRARSIAIVSATLEATERAGNDTTRAWDQFAAFVNAAQQAPTATDLVKGAMALLSPLVPRRKTDKVDGILAELDSIVLGRMPEPVQLGEIAQRLGKHPTAITHHLQRKYGISFSQYVARLRINRAKELLRRTRLGIGEVATRVGISDQSNFTKLFRKFEGLSPVQYRDLYRTR
jgi:AraC-like DNA-binding protein